MAHTPPQRNLPRVELGAGGYIIDPAGRLLLIEQQRGSDRHWGSIGGGREAGESVEECAIREMYEESGLRVRLERLIAVHEMYRRDELFAVGFMFLARPEPWPQDVQLPERDGAAIFHAHGWFGRDDLAGLDIYSDEMILHTWPADVQSPLWFRRDLPD